MKLNQLLFAVVAGVLFVFSSLAQDSATNRQRSIEALKQQIQELDHKVQVLEHQRELDQQPIMRSRHEKIQDLDQQVRILGRQRELDQESAATTAKALPKISAGANGFSFTSADTNFSLALHGVLQVDSRSFQGKQSVQGDSSFLCAGRGRSCRARSITILISCSCRILAATPSRYLMLT